MAADSPKLPFRSDWDTNCVPYEAFLGPHPAVGASAAAATGAAAGAGATGRALRQGQRALPGGGGGAAAAVGAAAEDTAAVPSSLPGAGMSSAHGRSLRAFWLGGACWLGFLTPPQLRALPQHYAPLTFVASEGPLPEALPLDNPRLALVTMLRRPLDRTLSSYRWWRFMLEAMPQAPGQHPGWGGCL